MKFKKFLEKTHIIIWLKTFKIKNYHINDDLTVDVDGDVNLFKKNLITIPIQFGIVKGDFNISYNKLTSLKGSPRIVHGMFNCSDNQLNNLIDGPKEVGGNYECQRNKLITLEGVAQKVVNTFNASHNQLQNLLNAPLEVGEFHFEDNSLISLDSNIEKVDYFHCYSQKKIKKLNEMTLPKMVNDFIFYQTPIEITDHLKTDFLNFTHVCQNVNEKLEYFKDLYYYEENNYCLDISVDLFNERISNMKLKEKLDQEKSIMKPKKLIKI